MNKEELKSEEKYLNGTIDTIEKALERVNNAVYQGEKEIREMSRFISNSYYDMDTEEIATQRNIMEQMQLQFLELTKTKTLLSHFLRSKVKSKELVWMRAKNWSQEQTSNHKLS